MPASKVTTSDASIAVPDQIAHGGRGFSDILPVSGPSGAQVLFLNRQPSGLATSLSVRRIDLTDRTVAFDGSHKALLERPCPAAAIVASDRDPSRSQSAGVTRVRDQHGSQSGGRAIVTSKGRCGPRRR
jgi:hypothetical protein